MGKATPLTEADFVGNLTIAARALSPRELGIGKAWYPVARAQVLAIANKHGVAYETACYAVAALSPGTTWVETLAAFLDLCRARELGGTRPPMGRGRWASRDRPKAWAILAGEPPADHCRGPKVEAFAANLLGDLDRVAVDRHVVRAATRQDLDQVSPRQTQEIENAVSAVARMVLGIAPAQFQAALWARSTRR